LAKHSSFCRAPSS